MGFGLLVARLIGSLQAKRPGQGGRVANLQTQRRISGVMPLLFAGVMIIVAPNGEGTNQALDFQELATFADLARSGLIRGIDPIRRPLKQMTH